MGSDNETSTVTKTNICCVWANLSLVFSARNAEGNSILSESGFHPNFQSHNSESLIIHAQCVWSHFESCRCEEELNHRLKNALSWKGPTGIHASNSWQYFCNSIPIALTRGDLPWCRTFWVVLHTSSGQSLGKGTVWDDTLGWGSLCFLRSAEHQRGSLVVSFLRLSAQPKPKFITAVNIPKLIKWSNHIHGFQTFKSQFILKIYSIQPFLACYVLYFSLYNRKGGEKEQFFYLLREGCSPPKVPTLLQP